MDIPWISSLSLNLLFLLPSYFILGGGIKFVDAAFDDDTFEKKLGVLAAPPLAILWVITMATDPYSATILLSIVLGVLLKGKIDNIAHILGFVVIMALVFVLQIHILWLPLIFLVASAILDEVGNDVIDYNTNGKIFSSFWPKYLGYFFGRRYFLKVALLFLVLLNEFPIVMLIALIFFDEAYLLITIWSEARSNQQKYAQVD